MNYILRESNDGKCLNIRADHSGKITGGVDIGNSINYIENGNRFADVCKDVWISSNIEILIEKGKEMSKETGLELVINS